MTALCRAVIACFFLMQTGSLSFAAESTFEKARIKAGLKNYDEAIELYDSILKVEPANADALNGKARVLAWMGKYEEARSVYQQVLSKDPSNAESLTGMADTYAWQKNVPKAIEVLENALPVNGDNRDILIRLARYYLWEGEKNKSLYYGNKILARHPEDGEVLGIMKKASALYRNEYYAGSYYLDINNNVNGINLYAGVRYKPDRTFSLYGQVDYLDRFNEEDVRLLVGGSRRFTGDLTLSGEISLTPDAELYPRASGWTELAYPLFSSFVIYSSVNLSHYQDIDLFGVSLAGEYYPVGNLALIGRITFSQTEFNTGDSADDSSFMIKGTWFFTDDDHLSLYYANGNESYKVETIDSVGDVEAKTYGISGLYFFTPLMGIAPSIEFQDRERGTEYLQFGLELRYRT